MRSLKEGNAIKSRNKAQTQKRSVINSLKEAKIYKRFLSMITAQGKDRDSLVKSLCHPWISWLL